MLYKMVYTVRNSYKQFMELELPEDAAIWTVMVDNKREKASRNKKGKVLIPLLRSSGSGDRLKSFNVQLIYTQPFEEFRVRGGSDYSFPKTDIFINKIRMEMHLPEGYSYDFDKGEWKEVIIAPKVRQTFEGGRFGQDKGFAVSQDRSNKKPASNAPKKGDKVSSDEKKVVGGELDDISPAPSVEESIVSTGKVTTEGFASKLKKEKAKRVAFTGPAGLSSISVYLPISGRKYVFSKTIIDKNESYPISFSYFHQQTLLAIYLLVGFVLLAAIFFYIRKRFKR
ncbi:MAG: hypothetical protein GY940_43510 [bacterium]|nr:hypothetical protein [bacterium]